MPEYLNENFLAVTNAELIFPAVQLCCAVIISGLSNGGLGPRLLGGYHLTGGDTVARYRAALNHLRGGFLNPVDTVDQVYLVGNALRTILHPPDHRALLQATLGCDNIQYLDKHKDVDSWAVRASIGPGQNHDVDLYYSSGNELHWIPSPLDMQVGAEMAKVRQDRGYIEGLRAQKVAEFLEFGVTEETAKRMASYWVGLLPADFGPMDFENYVGRTVRGCRIITQYGVRGKLKKFPPILRGMVHHGNDVHPNKPSLLQSISLKQASVQGGASVKGTVTLVRPTKDVKGEIIRLTSNHPAVIVPSKVKVVSNYARVEFSVVTAVVALPTEATIRATNRGAAMTVKLAVTV